MTAVITTLYAETHDVYGNMPSSPGELLLRHNQYFEAKTADTFELQQVAHALRYQVYCVERKFENPDEHASGFETDEYDAHALHGVLFYRPTATPIGTVRMIMPQTDGTDSVGRLPILSLLSESGGSRLEDHVDIDRCVEISRFAISKEYRRRNSDQADYIETPRLSRRDAVREGNLACLSLIQFLLRASAERGTLYWTAVMEPKLLRMLANMGIQFTSIGSLVMHHGLRQPCYCYVPAMLERVHAEHPEYWDVLTDHGVLSEQLRRSLPKSAPSPLLNMANLVAAQ
jgi:N-acyl amino acid synthase of PEP-CTERM/exosortase system